MPPNGANVAIEETLPSTRSLNEKCRQFLQNWYTKRGNTCVFKVVLIIDMVIVCLGFLLSIGSLPGNVDPSEEHPMKEWLIYSSFFLGCFNMLRVVLVLYIYTAKSICKPTFWMDFGFGLASLALDLYEMSNLGINHSSPLALQIAIVIFTIFRIWLTFYEFSQMQVRKLKPKEEEVEKEPRSCALEKVAVESNALPMRTMRPRTSFPNVNSLSSPGKRTCSCQVEEIASSSSSQSDHLSEHCPRRTEGTV